VVEDMLDRAVRREEDLINKVERRRRAAYRAKLTLSPRKKVAIRVSPPMTAMRRIGFLA